MVRLSIGLIRVRRLESEFRGGHRLAALPGFERAEEELVGLAPRLERGVALCSRFDSRDDRIPCVNERIASESQLSRLYHAGAPQTRMIIRPPTWLNSRKEKRFTALVRGSKE